MNNRDRKATELFKSHIYKSSEPSLDFAAWKIQAKSLIQNYIGTDSVEYKQISRKKLVWDGQDPKEETIREISEIKSILKSSILTIESHGVQKRNINFLNKIPNSLTGIILVAIIGLFGWLLTELWESRIKINKYELIQATTPLDSNKISTYEPQKAADKTGGEYNNSKIDSSKAIDGKR